MAMYLENRISPSRKLNLWLSSKLSSVPNTLVGIYDLAGKRKRNPQLKRRDSNGPSAAYTLTGANATKRRKTKTLANKGSNFVYSDLKNSNPV